MTRLECQESVDEVRALTYALECVAKSEERQTLYSDTIFLLVREINIHCTEIEGYLQEGSPDRVVNSG